MKADQQAVAFKFGDFEVREREYMLVKAGEAIPVEPKAFRVLLILLRNPKKLISKDELLQMVWGDTAVTENSLARSIALLRRLLGDETRNPRFIETVATVGYRFLCKVDVSEDPQGVSDRADGVPGHIGNVTTRVEGNETLSERLVGGEVEASPREPGIKPVATGRKRTLTLVAEIAVVALLVAAYLAVRQFSQPKVPTVVNIVRLTNDQKPKIPLNGVLTDGVHLYFMEGGPSGSGSGIAQVAAIGGETTWITTSLKDMLAIIDISPDKSKLLVGCVDGFWVQPLPAGTPFRIGIPTASAVYWTPDGAHIIYEDKHKIWISNEDKSDSHAIAEIPGNARWIRYSPDGQQVRFAILQARGNSSSLWEMHPDGTDLHQLLPNWKESLDQCCGRWSPDGKYFYFLSSAFFAAQGSGDTQAIWATSQEGSFFYKDNQPVRLTPGPLRFGAATPSVDGKRIFAVGSDNHVELFSYDPQKQRFDSYLGGLSAGAVAFSPDGKWIAYVSYPEMTLWKIRPDLSEKMQLTFPPVRAFLPRWSPDGAEIAFSDVRFHSAWKAYLVSAKGGDSPRQIAQSNGGDVDTDPNWTPDGKWIVFARDPGGDQAKQAIYRVNVNGGDLMQVPGSNGFYSPRVSPDGRYIAAFSEGAEKLMLLDQNTNTWSTLAEGEHFGFNEWSPDGKYVYAEGSSRIVRVGIKDRLLEEVLSLKNFPHLVDVFANWYGVTPDGKLLLMRDRSVQEIYALELASK